MVLSAFSKQGSVSDEGSQRDGDLRKFLHYLAVGRDQPNSFRLRKRDELATTKLAFDDGLLLSAAPSRRFSAVFQAN